MISEKMQKAINSQLNFEIYSAYIYQSMEAYYASLNLPGFANWVNVQVQEEMLHARKFFDFINSRGGRVRLETIEGPQTDWDSPLAAFENVLAHEKKVTERINDLVNVAMEERDHATVAFLNWFVTEQVEEEANADSVIRQLRLIGDDKSALFLLDRELATRVFTPPAPAAP